MATYDRGASWAPRFSLQLRARASRSISVVPVVGVRRDPDGRAERIPAGQGGDDARNEQGSGQLGVIGAPGQFQPLALPRETGPPVDVHAWVDPQEERREVHDQRPGAMARLQHATEQEIRGRRLSPQHGQVIGGQAEAGFQHAGDDAQLDQAVAEAEDLRPRVGPRCAAVRGFPRRREARPAFGPDREPGHDPVQQEDQRQRRR